MSKPAKIGAIAPALKVRKKGEICDLGLCALLTALDAAVGSVIIK